MQKFEKFNSEAQIIADFLESQGKLFDSAVTVFDRLENAMLLKRYRIDQLMDQGSHGTIYDVQDTKNPDHALVAKVQKCDTNFINEINAMIQISK